MKPLTHPIRSQAHAPRAARPILSKSIASRVKARLCGSWAVAAAGVAALVLGAAPAEAQTFTNPTAIVIPDSGPGNPSPSSILVTGVGGTINNITVSLTNFSHTFPRDVDILLQGPAGQNVILMADVGGGSGVAGLNLTFSDAAATPVPTPVVSGTFQPSNAGSADFTPGGGPAGPYGSTLAVFNGTVANGLWNLFVLDDTSDDTGTIAGGWSLTLLAGATTGPLLQNSAPVGVPTTADFIVDGPVETGGPTEDNTVNSLTFLAGSTLKIFNTLYVTTGPVNLVSNSSINLAGTLSASQLNVLFGGLLSGNGGINGNLVNSGLVSPGNSPGTINVSGNYTQTSTGTLRIEIGGRSAGQYDLLAVGGSAQLDGALQLVRLNKFKLKRGDTITFLTAGQGVEGEFAEVENAFTSDTILEPTVIYGDNSVALEMVQGSFADFAAQAGLTPNQRAVAGALDSAASDSAANPLFDYLDYQPLGELPGDFDKIAPEELTSIFTISTSLATVQGINLQRRTDDLRQGSSGFSASGLAMQGTSPGYSGSLFGVAGPTGKETKEMKQVLPEEKKWGAFLTGVGEWVDVDGDGNARGYDISTGGFTLGLDYKVCANFAIGIAAGYAGTAADLTDDGRVWVNGGKLGIYATTFIGGWYADAAVGGGYNSYDTKRSALQGTARGSTDGGELNVLVGTGYDWKIGALQIGPTATFQYTLVGIDGFTERGSLAPLTIDGQNVESVRTTLGIKASFDWKIGKVIVRPEIRAAWQHEYGDNSYGLDASFANGAGGSFLVNGPEIGRDSLLLGAGFAIQCSERCSTYFYYDGELGRSNYTSNAVSGGIRIAF